MTDNPGTLDRTEDGFLCNPDDWTPAIAGMLAAEDGIALGPAHEEIIALARRYFSIYGSAPGSRLLVRYIRRELGETKGSSLYLMQLFGGRAARTVSRIAGLPKPDHCL